MQPTDFFSRDADQTLQVESIGLDALAKTYGTPLYVYSKAAIVSAWQELSDAMGDFPGTIHYAVKANSNLAILQLLAQLGAGFDIVSGGELARVLKAGGDPDKIVFSGVGKTRDEIKQALEVKIHCLNVESFAEMQRIQDIAAEMDVKAPVSYRINPDVDAQTHPYISTGLKENKFGIPIDAAFDAYQAANALSHIKVIGVDFHIGSQLSKTEPFLEAIDKAIELIDQLTDAGITLQHFDMGGGMGVRYKDELPMKIQPIMDHVKPKLAERNLSLAFEPGRFIVANAGALVSQVEYTKTNGDKNFLVVDAAMNDLIRPALYSAWQEIAVVQSAQTETIAYDVVGPVCESADFLGKQRELAAEAGDYIAVLSSGAYAFGMASNYNSRARPAEVLVDGDKHYLVRARESIEQLFDSERLLDN